MLQYSILGSTFKYSYLNSRRILSGCIIVLIIQPFPAAFQPIHSSSQFILFQTAEQSISDSYIRQGSSSCSILGLPIQFQDITAPSISTLLHYNEIYIGRKSTAIYMEIKILKVHNICIHIYTLIDICGSCIWNMQYILDTYLICDNLGSNHGVINYTDTTAKCRH